MFRGIAGSRSAVQRFFTTSALKNLHAEPLMANRIEGIFEQLVHSLFFGPSLLR